MGRLRTGRNPRTSPGRTTTRIPASCNACVNQPVEPTATLDVRLGPADLREIGAALPPGATAGARYPEATMRSVGR